jgi:hypothetical protein
MVMCRTLAPFAVAMDDQHLPLHSVGFRGTNVPLPEIVHPLSVDWVTD